jgi:hypothetical protein
MSVGCPLTFGNTSHPVLVITHQYVSTSFGGIQTGVVRMIAFVQSVVRPGNIMNLFADVEFK